MKSQASSYRNPRLLFLVCVLTGTLALMARSGSAGDKQSDIVPPGAELEELWNEGEFTEGVAVAPDGTIYFSDIPRDESPGRVMKFDPRSEKTTVHSADSGKSNGLMFDRKGRLIAACGANAGKRALCKIDHDGSVSTLVGEYQDKTFNSPNDLVIHPKGSVYFSDPRYTGSEPMELDHMSVYRYDPDGTIERVTTNIQRPNGVAVSPDGGTLYVAETDPGSPSTSLKMTLNAFPIKPNGRLGDKKVIVDFGDHPGVDGMTVDEKGNIYAAVRADSRHGIIIFNPKGEELGHIPTETLPTNCCFGNGDESNRLYVTAGTGLYRITLNAKGFHPSAAK